MTLRKKILGVIPARGGSKGIPNKNIINLCGRPLISYTLDAAKKSRYLTDVIVSTDSKEIAAVAKSFGGHVPFMRPNNLAADSTPSAPVVAHAIDFMENLNKFKYDAVILLQPTTPLRITNDIDKVINLWIEERVDSVVSVVNVGSEHPLRMKRIIGNRLINYIDQGVEDMRPRQHLPSVYIRNGAVYLRGRDAFMNSMSLVGENVLPYIMPEERSINIDAIKDLVYAEFVLSKILN